MIFTSLVNSIKYERGSFGLRQNVFSFLPDYITNVPFYTHLNA